jgi:hypothetical protein
MAKKNEDVVALVPAPDLSTALAPLSTRHGLTAAEKGIIDESYKQRLAIEAIRVKEDFGTNKIAEIHFHVNSKFDETAGGMIEAKNRPGRSKEHQEYVDQFTRHQMNMLAQHLSGVLEVSASNIGMILHQSAYPPEPERQGLLSRLLFG